MMSRPIGLRLGRSVAALAALALAVSGCLPGNPSAGKLQVVATTTVLADLVANVGGADVSVASLVPKNADAHTFEPRPSDVRNMAEAKVLFMNGLGLDDWLEKTMSAISAGGTLVKLGENLPGVELLPGETAGTENPHLFLDPLYARLYVGRIEAALVAADPAHESAYHANAAAYEARLADLDRWVRAQIDTIPQADRKLVTFHNAFPYYAREYGIQIVGVAVQAPGQDPSAGYTAQLIATIKAAGVKVIFSEAQFPPKLVDELAAEAGCKVVSNLYDDSLGDPPVTSYIEVIRWDTTQLVEGLR